MPVYEEGNGSILYSFTITRYLPGVPPDADVAASDMRIFYKAYNQTIPELYAQALDFPLEPNRLILDVQDSSRFVKPQAEAGQDWDSGHRWVYNLILPKAYEHPERFAIADYDRFFGIRASVEKRNIKCLLLVKKGTKERWRIGGGEGYADTYRPYCTSSR